MQNFEQIRRELEKSGKADGLKALAETEKGRRLAGMVDRQALERAARQGDAQALKAILSQVMSSPEGRELKASIERLMGR